jgi:PBP1b-binding outer membrane lipoprotein LpoB
MKQIAGIAIVTIMLVGCSNRVAPKRTTFAAPEALIVAKAGPSDVYPEVQLTPGVTNPNVTQANTDFMHDGIYLLRSFAFA